MLTLMAMIAGSWISLVALMIRQSSRHETSIDSLDTKLTGRIDSLDTKLTGRTGSLGRDMANSRERPGRVEGHLTAPEGFRPRPGRPPSEDDRPSDGPEPGRRQAG